MNSRKRKIIYTVATTLLSLMMLATVGNGLFNPEFTSRFVSIGYPEYLITPLMIAKICGLIIIWVYKNKVIAEWSYAGFCILFILAFLAEFHAVDSDYFSPVLAMIFLMVSYRFKPE